MQKTKIEWCSHTWNPVVGCKRGCQYCYARRIHNRFNKTPFSHIKFNPSRLLDKMPKEPSRIFVGSMSDFEYWKPEYVQQIFDVCRNNPEHTFMFLTKESRGYCGYPIPDNVKLGLTLTKCDSKPEFDNLDFHTRNGMKNLFLSIEPLQGMFLGKIRNNVETVIVGAMTGPCAIEPKPEWIQSIKDHVPEEKIFWKSNIKNMVGA